MANNDQILLDQIVEEQRLARLPAATKSDFFELYVAEQVLKDFDLSDEEVEYGVVGGSRDGGIDGIYTFANGELVQEDFDHTTLKKNVVIEVVIIQSKTSNGFDEDSMNKLIAVTGHLFALAHSLENYADVYNGGIRDGVENFRRLYQAIAARFPTLRFHYIYATRGDSTNVHPNVRRKADDLGKVVAGLFPNAVYEFDFHGATELLALARRQPTTSFEMRYTESLTGKDGYIALVRLSDFISFIRAPNNQLRKNLFEANVRDYQGNNQVNEEMQKSLVEGGPEDFWWLNNGVTVVASKAVQGGKILTIEDPQIVNGQQTSTEIFNYFQTSNTQNDERCVMVRVIVANNPASRDRIIKATNSQTAIPAASLRATEKIHRDIEEFLAPFLIYYDRRKNSQKQQGRPMDKIISIGLMAQAMMAIVLQRPNDARARPSSLLKKDEDYANIFSDKLDIKIYLIAAKLVKAAHAFLRTQEEMEPKDRNNLLFYLAMHAAAVLAQKANPHPNELAALSPEAITEELLQSSLQVVLPMYTELGGNDHVAKGTHLSARIKAQLAEQFAHPNS